MQRTARNSSTAFRLGLASATAALLLAAVPARGQVHEIRLGSYTLRSSTVGSWNLSQETARKHGIEPGPNRAVINVTVMKKEGNLDVTVPARVEVTARELTGQMRAIPMRDTTYRGWVSYMGTYDFTHGEVIDFIVTAQPENPAQILTMTYRERMWSQGKPAP